MMLCVLKNWLVNGEMWIGCYGVNSCLLFYGYYSVMFRLLEVNVFSSGCDNVLMLINVVVCMVVVCRCWCSSVVNVVSSVVNRSEWFVLW